MVDKKMSHEVTLTAQYNITFENTLCRSRKKVQSTPCINPSIVQHVQGLFLRS